MDSGNVLRSHIDDRHNSTAVAKSHFHESHAITLRGAFIERYSACVAQWWLPDTCAFEQNVRALHDEE